MRLVQLRHPRKGRRIAVVRGDQLELVSDSYQSVYGIACKAIEQSIGLLKLVGDLLCGEQVPYDQAYAGGSEWRILPAFDHPHEPSRCLVSGTGLTHRLSAEARQQLHQEDKLDEPELTDSMRVYHWGLEGGRPEPGCIGVQPEWFYKGGGKILRAHNEPLEIPAFADDGGEEAEVAGAYVIAPDGSPKRVGLMQGNEFSDHIMESRNYLYLAPSKLRDCAVGPEIVIDSDFSDVSGSVRIERSGKTEWQRAIATGEANMSHSLANLEYHHFKYSAHRCPGDAHIHFVGADAVSFGDSVTLLEGDVMVIELKGFGRPLRNPVTIDRSRPTLVLAESLG